MSDNYLYYGDILDILRRYAETESVDLVQLDPPFKSNQDYNVLFKERDGIPRGGRKSWLLEIISSGNSRRIGYRQTVELASRRHMSFKPFGGS